MLLSRTTNQYFPSPSEFNAVFVIYWLLLLLLLLLLPLLHAQMRLSYGASESCYTLRSALRRNKGREQDQLAVVVADMKRRSPTSAELPPDINAFDDPAVWASQVIRSNTPVLEAKLCTAVYT